MSEHSTTRAELERALRDLVPARVAGASRAEPPESTTAAAGVGGLIVGYAWGWWRGRRGARARAKAAKAAAGS